MNPPSAPRGFGQQLLRIAGVAVVYYGAARLGLALQFSGTNASPVWPPTGIAFAAVLLLGYRVWPGIMIGAFVANLLTLPQSVAGFAASIAICIGNTLESVIGAFLVRRSLQLDGLLERKRDVLVFVAVALAMCLISSTIGPASLLATGVIQRAILGDAWFTWWLGDVAGALVLTPAIVSWARPPRHELSLGRVAESLVLFVLLTLAVHVLFSGRFVSGFIDTMPYSIITGVLWAATRLKLRETATAVVLVAAVATIHTLDYRGPFFRMPPELSMETVKKPDMVLGPSDLAKKHELLNQSLLMLQIFVCAVSVTGLMVAAAVAEHSESEAVLKQANETHEQQLAGTTAELTKATDELSAAAAGQTRAEQDLARSNQELDDVRYVAAHDLKEPVRGIAKLSTFLAEDFGAKLGENGRARLDTVQRLARRLDHLTDWLVCDARPSHVELAMTDTDLDKLVAELLEAMRPILEQAGVEVRTPRRLGRRRCNREQIAEVFRALIMNAMKHNDRPVRWIEISVQDSHNVVGPATGAKPPPYVFTVRDNGPGIPAKDLQTIFRIFKRPHGVDQYDGGTGVGLATAQKIIARHGGRIWVESSATHGTSFNFTLQTS